VTCYATGKGIVYRCSLLFHGRDDNRFRARDKFRVGVRFRFRVGLELALRLGCRWSKRLHPKFIVLHQESVGGCSSPSPRL